MGSMLEHDERNERILALTNLGWSRSEIAAELGIKYSVVSSVVVNRRRRRPAKGHINGLALMGFMRRLSHGSAAKPTLPRLKFLERPMLVDEDI
jgi:hypothetical protein